MAVVEGVVGGEDLVAGVSVLFQRGGRRFQLSKGCRISVRSYLAGQPWQLLVNLNIENLGERVYWAGFLTSSQMMLGLRLSKLH